MQNEFQNEITPRIVGFLREIGLTVSFANVDDDTFLPGINVINGGLLVDESKLLYPGDLLHEAGHLAVVPSAARAMLSGELRVPDADVIESAAISWSYAACLPVGLEPEVVFHENGYHGNSANLLFGFELGVFPGLHELVSAGMTLDAREAERLGLQPFPVMQKWLRE